MVKIKKRQREQTNKEVSMFCNCVCRIKGIDLKKNLPHHSHGIDARVSSAAVAPALHGRAPPIHRKCFKSFTQPGDDALSLIPCWPVVLLLL